MTEHILKQDTAYFDAVARGDKNFEVRRDDRGFQKGDTLTLVAYGKDRSYKVYDYAEAAWVNAHMRDADRITATITYVLTGGQLGIEPGYVVMGLANIKVERS
jgi:hypothetical protein